MIWPGAGISMPAVHARNDHARQMVAGFAVAVPSLSRLWQQLDGALADVPVLAAELSDVRLDQTRLMAAIQAALAAHAAGEDDPLSYLRDGLPGDRPVPAGSRRPS